LLRPKFNTLGNEFAGVIEHIGKAVTAFEVGNKVFGYNDVRFGAHAEYMIMTEDDPMTTMPDQFTFEEAAPICEGAHYALCDIRAAGVKPGQEVLIYGATGAIGSAAVQLLRHFDAKVTAVCATPHILLVKSLGADRVIDYTREDFTQTDIRYDFLFDAVGKTSFGTCRPILKAKGIYISTELGKNGENIFLALTTPLFGGKKVLFPLPSITKADVLFLKELAETGQFKPLIDRRYPLEQIVDAYRYVESGQKIGNVVINVP
jgi:NADPH:quinone reductase-like Zn-dependent oxidoreductase